MIRNVVTIQEDALMEDAAMTMLKNDIGCLPVVDANGEISGILTQNDVFNAFLEILGYREEGSRIIIGVKDELGAIGEISKVFVRNHCNITHIGVYRNENGQADIIFRIDSFETAALEKDLEDSGYRGAQRDPSSSLRLLICREYVFAADSLLCIHVLYESRTIFADCKSLLYKRKQM